MLRSLDVVGPSYDGGEVWKYTVNLHHLRLSVFRSLDVVGPSYDGESWRYAEICLTLCDASRGVIVFRGRRQLPVDAIVGGVKRDYNI